MIPAGAIVASPAAKKAAKKNKVDLKTVVGTGNFGRIEEKDVLEKAGKALRKDNEQGKQTFVTLMGIDKAREQARALVDQAIAHLAAYGSEADILRALARFIVERDR